MQITASVAVGFLPMIVVVAVGLVAATIDFCTFKVHNLVTFPLLLAGLVYHLLLGGLPGLGFSLAGAAFGFAALIVFYAAGGIGAGDVKLMTGIGAWLGMPAVLHVVLFAGVATGIYAVLLMLFAGGVRNVLTNLAIVVYRVRAMAVHFGTDERVEAVVKQSDDRRRRLIPFAAMVALGIFGVLVREQLVK